MLGEKENMNPINKNSSPTHLQNNKNTNNVRTNKIHNIYNKNIISNENPNSKNNLHEIDNKISRLNDFLNCVYNSRVSNTTLLENFKNQIDQETFDQICIAAASLDNSKEKSAGEKILKSNFRALLFLKDIENRNPIEKLLDHLKNKREITQAIQEIESLKKDPTIEAFNKLSPRAQGTLCYHVWQIANQPQEWGFGEKIIRFQIEKIKSIDSYGGQDLANPCLLKLTQELTHPFHFTTSSIINRELQMEPSDTTETMENLYAIYQLQDFTKALNDPNKNNDFLISKFEAFPKNLKETLTELYFIAHWNQMSQFETQISDVQIIKKNMRAFLKIQNQEHTTIIEQLLSIYCKKHSLLRRKEQLDRFIQLRAQSTNKEATLRAFNQLDQQTRWDLETYIYYLHKGRPNFKDTWQYGHHAIQTDISVLSECPPFSRLSIVVQCRDQLHKEYNHITNTNICNELKKHKMILPEKPIEVSTRSLEEKPSLKEHLPQDLRTVHVTAELKIDQTTIASTGGLAVAVGGMVSGFGVNSCRVVMPLYRNGPISETILNQMKETDHQIWVEDQKVKIFKAKINGLRCYFVDHGLFWIPKKENNSTGNLYDDVCCGPYEDKFHNNRHKWTIFQSAAADLCYLFSKKTNPIHLVHHHDSQTALVPKLIATRHSEEWMRGETPTTVFTFHNNAEPMEYNDHISCSYLQKIGLEQRNTNSFIEALLDDDAVFTVSETYGKEVQTSQFGQGIKENLGTSRYIKKIAFEGKFFGIQNGNTHDWNPATHPVLKEWKSVLPESKNQTIDLRITPDMDFNAYAEVLKRAQKELCYALKSLDREDPGFADLDPEKPIGMYVGRYDSGQKWGKGELLQIMEETLGKGGQFICIGTGADENAKKDLEIMKKRAKELGNKGVLILEDTMTLKYQRELKLGPLMRLACLFGVFPSLFEPCGIIQQEFHLQGKETVLSQVGGFNDTGTSEGPAANTYFFNRHSSELTLSNALDKAIKNAKLLQNAMYHPTNDETLKHLIKHRQRIMQNALDSTWETTPKTKWVKNHDQWIEVENTEISPIGKIYFVYAEAFRRKQSRGIIPCNLQYKAINSTL